ncbi:MAG TPA: DUF3108 domain-containing protein [Candidatus Binataceae bacterium]
MRKARLRCPIVLILSLALSGLARGNPPVDPLPAGIQTPGYAPGRVPFHPGQQLSYTVSWQQLPVAFAHISLRRDPGRSQDWLGEASVSTNKLVDVFYRLRSSLREEFPAQSLASDAVFIRHSENGRQTEYSVSFDRADGMVETTRRKHDHVEVKRFAASHPLGPIGASLLAISQPIKVGDSMTLDVFAATERYVVQFRVARREQIHLGVDDVETFRVIPTILYVSNPKNHYKVSQAVIWISADQRHLPLRIEADTFVGRIYIDLDRNEKIEKRNESQG